MYKKADGSRFDSAIRAKPHLRPKKMDGPGPGDYELPGAVRVHKRNASSTQHSTFGGANRDWSDLPQNTPGPTAYSQIYPKPPEQRAFSNDGYSFPKDGEKSPTGGFLKIAANPGPGSYNPDLLKNGTSKPMLGGSIEPEKLKDNGVPGPGMYDPEDLNSVPSFLIVNKKRAALTKNENSKEAPVGPQKYDLIYPGETFKGQKYPGQKEEVACSPDKLGSFGNARRDGKGSVNEDEKYRKVRQAREKTTQYLGVPGPGNYKITGDFDFRDPTRPDDRSGKNPKFCFGMKTALRAKNLDMPGPGEYEVDVYPMNQSNIAYWIGTDVRRDLAVPYSHLYPGPGSYDGEDIKKEPAVSFPRDPKNTSVEKTNDPGPGTYAHFSSVGVMAAYQRNEANARVPVLHAKTE